MRRSGSDYFYHSDEQFNVVAASNAQGEVVERYVYGDYGAPTMVGASGQVLTNSAIGNPYMFNGRRWDGAWGLELYYYRTRYLDPVAGRFITRDTIGIWGDAGNLGNGYAYVGNNPWTWVDPYGLNPSCPREEEEESSFFYDWFYKWFGRKVTEYFKDLGTDKIIERQNENRDRDVGYQLPHYPEQIPADFPEDKIGERAEDLARNLGDHFLPGPGKVGKKLGKDALEDIAPKAKRWWDRGDEAKDWRDLYEKLKDALFGDDDDEDAQF